MIGNGARLLGDERHLARLGGIDVQYVQPMLARIGDDVAGAAHASRIFPVPDIDQEISVAHHEAT